MCKTEHDGMSNITVHLDKIYLNYQWRNKDYRGYEHGLWNHYLLQFGPLDVHVNSPLPFFYKMGTIRLRTLYFISTRSALYNGRVKHTVFIVNVR